MEKDTKKYEFRKLNSTDLFPLMKLVKKIGVKSFAGIIESIDVSSVEGEDKEYEVGLTTILKIADLLIDRLADCEKEIYAILERISDLSFDELKALDIDVFVEMIIDFVKKDEFMAFSNAVLKLLN